VVEISGLAELRELLRDRPVDLDEMLRRLVDGAAASLRADRGTLFLIDPQSRQLVSRVAHLPELREIRLKVGEGLAGWVARTGRMLNMPRGAEDPRLASRVDLETGYKTRSVLAAPVRLPDGRLVGVLQALNKIGGDFDEADEAVITSLARQVAEVLDISSLGRQLAEPSSQPLAFRFNRIVGDSPVMHEVYERISRAARTTATVLVRGESGTGKELVARAIHDNSTRSWAPFVAVDLSALPYDLIENELFGHVRGAFTGADRDRPGKVEAAEGGTLFLDELGELPLPAQSRLLRLLQERTYFPVGANRSRKADLRFVAATHRPLEKMVQEGRFRQDLYYRLRVVEIALPPLRECGPADIDRLVDHFLHEYRQRHGRPELRLNAEARELLRRSHWPGNVRELQHCLESAVVLCPGERIDAAHLPLAAPVPLEEADHLPTLREVELAHIRRVMAAVGGNRSEAARRLGIGRNTLQRALREAGISD
jgi:Nif-specific regulatory protein